MKDFATLTDQQLLEQIGDLTEQEKEAKRAADPLREELLRRMRKGLREDGVDKFDAGDWEASLAKEPISFAWLKRTYGFEPKDLPDGIIVEKVVPDLDGARLVAWLEEDGSKVEPTYALRVKRKKAA